MSFVDKFRKQKLLSLSLVLFTLSIGILIGTVISTSARAAKDQSAAPGATPLVIPRAAPIQSQFGQLAKQLASSVVNISTIFEPKPAPQAQGRRRQPQQPPDEGEDDGGMNDFFRRFFGSPFGGETPAPGPSRKEPERHRRQA